MCQDTFVHAGSTLHATIEQAGEEIEICALCCVDVVESMDSRQLQWRVEAVKRDRESREKKRLADERERQRDKTYDLTPEERARWSSSNRGSSTRT